MKKQGVGMCWVEGAMKAKEKDEKDAAKVADKVAALVANAAAKTVKVEQQKVNPPEHVVALVVGNSAGEIGESEENFEFSRVSVREQTEAKKWFRAAKPSSSRNCGAEVDAAYGVGWTKWIWESACTYKGNLISEWCEGEISEK
jgi:hypothetical protein